MTKPSVNGLFSASDDKMVDSETKAAIVAEFGGPVTFESRISCTDEKKPDLNVKKHMSDTGKASELVDVADLGDGQTAGGTTKATHSRSDGRKESVESNAYGNENGAGFSDLMFE